MHVSKGHRNTRRDSYTPRAHDMVERPRIYSPIGGEPVIGLWGEGVKHVSSRTEAKPDLGLAREPRREVQRPPDGTLAFEPRSKGLEGK